MSLTPTYAERLRQSSSPDMSKPAEPSSSVLRMLGADNSSPSQEAREKAADANPSNHPVAAEAMWSRFMSGLPSASSGKGLGQPVLAASAAAAPAPVQFDEDSISHLGWDYRRGGAGASGSAAPNRPQSPLGPIVPVRPNRRVFDINFDDSNAGLSLLVKRTTFHSENSLGMSRKRQVRSDDASSSGDSNNGAAASAASTRMLGDEDLSPSRAAAQVKLEPPSPSSPRQPPQKKTKIAGQRAGPFRQPAFSAEAPAAAEDEAKDEQMAQDEDGEEDGSADVVRESFLVRAASEPAAGTNPWAREEGSHRLVRRLSGELSEQEDPGAESLEGSGLTNERLAELPSNGREDLFSSDGDDLASLTGTLDSSCKGPSPKRLSDDERLLQRQRQIDLGKNTDGYRNFQRLVPKHRRKKGQHPRTPNKAQECSKRSWDGQIRIWRRLLHLYDPVEDTDGTKHELYLDPLQNLSPAEVTAIARDPERVKQLHLDTLRRQQNGEQPSPSRARSSPQLSHSQSTPGARRSPNRNSSGRKPQGSTPPRGAASAQPQSRSPRGPQLDAAELAPKNPEEQRQILGEHIYARISEQHPELAGKLTGMLLEIEPHQLVQVYNDPDTFETQVQEALEVYDQAQQQ